MFRVEFLSDPDALTDLRDRWESFNALLQDHDAPFFQSYDWVMYVAMTRLHHSRQRFRLLVATVWRDTQLVGLWPLSMQRKAGALMVCSVDDPFGQFAGVVFESREMIAPGVFAIIQELRHRRIADGMQIDGVILGSSLHEALLHAGGRRYYLNHAVFLDFRPYATVKEYRSTLNKKTLKNLRNFSNRLKRTLVSEHATADGGEELKDLIERTYDARIEWLRTNARTSPAFRDSDFRPLVEKLALSNVPLIGFALQSEKDYLSAQWGFIYQRRYYSYMSSKNPKYDAFSPGRLHLGMVADNCMTRGLDALELMAPASDYKLEWSDTTKQLDTFSMSFTARGYLLHEVMINILRPLVRAASRLIPQLLRRRLIGLLNRD